MRTGYRLGAVPSIFFVILLFLSGCASMAERGLLPDVKARRPPDVLLGKEILLLKEVKVADGSHFASLIGTDGRAHLFVADGEGQVRHVEISEQGILRQEILGAIEGRTSHRSIDAVEHPAGRLRVLAGDKQFIRSAAKETWEEIKGSPCSKFLVAGDDLLCAFIAGGKEIGAPARTDWTIGWFILLPIVAWENTHADKLVLAQETGDGWVIRAVIDPETKLSAWPDFTAGTDRNGSLHFLYRASGGGSAFIVAFGAGGGGAWASGPEQEIRYARVRYAPLLSENRHGVNPEMRQGQRPSPWMSIQGLLLAPLPYVSDKATSLSLIGPLDRCFTVNRATGNLEGLLWIYNRRLEDGTHRMEILENPWISSIFSEGHWMPHFGILTARNLPESGIRWLNDRGALIRNDSNENHHVLLIQSKHGVWKWDREMCYLIKRDVDWSAPLALGSNPATSARRSLAADGHGKVFAVWEDGNRRILGRWILPNK